MWHAVYEDHAHNLQRRRALGWVYADHEDAQRAGVEVTSAQTDLDGASYVLADHKNVKSILLKIPKEINRLNSEAIRAIRNKESLKDVYGNLTSEKVTQRNGSSITIERDEGTIYPELL
jgi:hypothetical protein